MALMPSHQDRREPLPKGYQFGDAGRRMMNEHHPRIAIRYVKPWDITPDPQPFRMDWYVIEGEPSR